MEEYEAQLLVVEAKLAKNPDDEELLAHKADLLELIELSGGLEPPKSSDTNNLLSKNNDNSKKCDIIQDRNHDPQASISEPRDTAGQSSDPSGGARRPLTEAELEAKRKEKNRKKKAKLREKVKEQSDIAESEKQSWQSFTSKKGLKGITKKSIFATPLSTTGKVGVGTNGIADAPTLGVVRSAHKSASFASTSGASSSIGARRKH